MATRMGRLDTDNEVRRMKLLSIAIPSYNSEAYLKHAVDSLLPGGDEVEILIVNDGSKDGTAEIADDYERRYPGIVRAVHKENGGHGDAVMTGLANATGLYFKVVDSDDWVDDEAYPKVLECLRGFVDEPIDLLISNYIFDKVGVTHKKVIHAHGALPIGRIFGWEEARHFKKGQYLMMHSMIYRTQLLRDCGLSLPKHTFYVDSLYCYVPLKDVERMYYLDVDFYHYYIGRDDQSVHESVLIKRIDQYLRVNRLLYTSVDLKTVKQEPLKDYLINFLEIVTTISSTMCILDGSDELLKKKDDLWAFIRDFDSDLYDTLRHRFLGRAMHLPGACGHAVVKAGYKIAHRIFGFN